MRTAACLALIAVLGPLGGCVTLPRGAARNPQDPWESWNRGVYKVNDALDRALAKPVARTYVKVVPQPIRTGVSNFFTNLEVPTVMVNDALQGKVKAAGSDFLRFAFNTTVGLGGILDPATSAGLDRNDEDFGQTLGKWGVHPGPFVELPVLGPSDVRDTIGSAADTYTNPRHYVRNLWVRYGLYLPDVVNRRAQLLSLDDTLTHAYDTYAVIRDAYLQRRQYLVTDGKPDETPPEDPDAPH